MNYLTEELRSDIKDEFPDIIFEYSEINFGGIIPTFFINIKDEENLTNKWKAITEFIAVHFQSSLRNEFSVWNIYLFFILEQEIKDDLKYIIENDTFSSRKIIIYPNQDVEIIIQEHIKNDDIKIQSIMDFVENQFQPNLNIWKILNEIPYKKKITEDIKNGLDEIIQELKKVESDEV
ncbi:ABC-three component system middle component 1 [Algoriella sp.]|uniref:ABC-three component system middle component 1 n=1 Tax=Algoriella sp. TaxID=1872434 RepID=UPI002FC9D831